MADGPALITHPVIAGSGRRLFEPGDSHSRLELVDSAVSTNGNVVTTFAMLSDSGRRSPQRSEDPRR